MFFAAELPLLLLFLLPRAKYYCLTVALIYLLVCVCQSGKARIALRPRHPYRDLSLLIPLAVQFAFAWHSHARVVRISRIIGIHANLLTVATAIALCFLALPGLDALVCQVLRQPGRVEARTNSARRLAGWEIWACLAIAFVTALQFRSRPFLTQIPGQDSSVFIYIGRRMHDGFVPYRDMFDHKGPLLYVINWLGAFLRPEQAPYLGLWLLELLNMFVFCCAALKTANELTPPQVHFASLLIVAICTFYCGRLVYQGGNLSEEFALPWLSISLYIFIHYFHTHEFRNRDVFLLGFGLGAVLLLRPNLIGPWAALTPAVLFSLLLQKRFSELGKCALFYSLGIAALLVPMLAWLGAFHALPAMWKDYIAFNFMYTGEGAKALDILPVARFILNLIPLASPAIYLTLPCLKEQKALRANFFAFLCSLVFVCMSGRMYGHYGIALLPLMVAPLASWITPLDCLLACDTARRTRNIRLPLYLLLSFVVLMRGFASITSAQEFSYDEEVAYLREQTAPDEDVLILGNPWDYILSDRYTSNRFFYQLPPLFISEELNAEFLRDLESRLPDAILLPFTDQNELSPEYDGLEPALQLLRDQCESGSLTYEAFPTFQIYRRIKK